MKDLTDQEIDAYWDARAKELNEMVSVIEDLFLARKIAVAEILYIFEALKYKFLLSDEFDEDEEDEEEE